jgi:hypothetical protein
MQGSLDAATPHELVDVFDAKDVINLEAQRCAAASLGNALSSAAAAAAAAVTPIDASGVVWISVKCLGKGYPHTGATLHAATADDYAGFMGGSRTFEGEREVIGFVTYGQVMLARR